MPWLSCMRSPRCWAVASWAGLKSGLERSLCADSVTWSIALSKPSVTSGCAAFRWATFATSVLVLRGWRVLTRRRGSSGKLYKGVTVGGRE